MACLDAQNTHSSSDGNWLFFGVSNFKIQGEEDGGSAYSCLYLAPTSEKLEEYHATHAPALQQDHALRYGGKFAAFRTNLTVIEEFKAS